MPGRNFLLSFGLFLIFVGLAIYVPQMNNMFINLTAASENLRLLFKVAFLIIGFAFLFRMIEDRTGGGW